MAMNRHVILNHIDTPLKILFWTKGEIVLFMGPFLGGLLMDSLVVGMGVSFLNAWLVSQYKKRFGRGQCQAVMYWYLPHPPRLRGLPHSYRRHYRG